MRGVEKVQSIVVFGGPQRVLRDMISLPGNLPEVFFNRHHGVVVAVHELQVAYCTSSFLIMASALLFVAIDHSYVMGKSVYSQ